MIRIQRNQKLRYFKSLLIVYTIVIAVFVGVSAFAFVNSDKSEAAVEITNICGGGNGCPVNCDAGGCPVPAGNVAFRFTCDGRETDCRENEQKGVSNIDVKCGETQQVDVFNHDCRAGGGWSCGDTDLQGYVVVYGGACDGEEPECPDGDDDGICDEDELRVCGQTCEDDNDCRQDLGPTTCADSGPNAGLCVNTLCPNDTQGASCGCNDIENSCGERCGIAYGLCEDGYTCTYAEPTCNWSTSTPIAYCLPSNDQNLNPAYEYVECTENDLANNYLRRISDGKVTGFTEEQLNLACTPPLPETKTCYRCTQSNTDGNTCEPFEVQADTSCPAGTSDTPAGCAAATESGQCPVEEKHMECVNYACTEVSGGGSDTCEVDADCEEVESHLECVNYACAVVDGAGSNECTTTADCLPDENPNYTIVKIAGADNDTKNGTNFEIGDTTDFIVKITNTGDVEITELRFEDTWDSFRLGLINGNIKGTVAKKNANGSTVQTINDVNNMINSKTGNKFVINNMATMLGTLMPGQYYEFLISYQAINTNCADNQAVSKNVKTKSGGMLTDKNALAKVCIVNQDTDL